jgi:guanylate kinase
MQELRMRLERRAEDKSDVIARRLANARDEIGHWIEYDYIVVNAELEPSLAAVRSILVAERHSRARLKGMPAFVDRLLGEK